MPSGSFLKRFGRKLAARDGWNCHYCHKPLIPLGISDGDPVYFDSPFSTVYKGEVVIRSLPKTEYSRPVVDHKIPRSQGGTDALENLVLSCWSCNHLKSDRYSYEAFKTLVSERGVAR